MSDLRTRLIRLAAAKPELRADLLPLLQEQADPASHDQNKPETYYGLPPRGIQASDTSEAADILENFMGLVGDEPSSHNKKQWDAAHKALKSKDVAAIYKAFVDLEQSEGGEPPDDDEDVAGHWNDLKRGMRKFKPKQAARRREDPNRVVFKVSRQLDTGEFTVHNLTGGKKYVLSAYGSDPQELAETLESSASASLRFQNMDTLDGPELNVVKAPRFPRNLAERIIAQATVIVGAHYVALQGGSMGLQWVLLPHAPKFA